MKNKTLKIKEYISKKTFLLIFTAIFIVIAIVFAEILSLRINNTTNLAKESLRFVGREIDSAAKTAVDHIMVLRDAAQIDIDEQAQPVPSELYLSLTSQPNQEKYELRTLPLDYDKNSASYILGGGTIPEHSTPTAQEIEASLKLNPLFSDIKHNIPQVAWVYYYSANRFINMYPFENQADTFTWSDSYLSHPLFLQAAPEQNPERDIKWFKAYIDEAGKGLMISIVAPVYDKKSIFRGVVGMDFTLETMKNYISIKDLGIGTPILVNRQGQVLAYPNEANSDDNTLKQLNDVLPAELKSVSESILTIESGQYYDISNWKVYALDIDNAPWRLIFIVDKNKLLWKTVGKMWMELMGVFMIIFIVTIINQRRLITQKLRTYKAAVDSSSAAIIITDRFSKIQYINKSFTDITGYSQEQIVGRSMSDLRSANAYDEVYEGFLRALTANGRWKGEVLNKKKDGTLYWASVLLSPVTGNKSDGYYVAVMEDITERKTMIEELNRLATIDVLTNVTNRGQFLAAAEIEFKRSERYRNDLSVMMLDIDHFKNVNDTYGHKTGDIVLQHFAAKCRELIRSQDSIGRFGGEEFVILLPEINSEGAYNAAERIRQAIEAMEVDTPDEGKVKITCSIGVAQKKKDEASFDLLLSRADKALYEAKHSGRNKVIADFEN